MSIDNIVNYVMKTPQNTNKMVLKGLIESEIEKCGEGTSDGSRAFIYRKGENEVIEFGDVVMAKISDEIPSKNDVSKCIVVLSFYENVKAFIVDLAAQNSNDLWVETEDGVLVLMLEEYYICTVIPKMEGFDGGTFIATQNAAGDEYDMCLLVY